MNPSEWNPKVRKFVYAALTVLGIALGTGLAYFGGTGDPVPKWLIGSSAAFAFLSSATGLMAVQNTPASRAGQDAQHEVDRMQTTQRDSDFEYGEHGGHLEHGADGVPDIPKRNVEE